MDFLGEILLDDNDESTLPLDYFITDPLLFLSHQTTYVQAAAIAKDPPSQSAYSVFEPREYDDEWTDNGSSPLADNLLITNDCVTTLSINKCGYRTGKCPLPRVLKKDGQFHNLCDNHRRKANASQKKIDRKKRRPKKPKYSHAILEKTTTVDTENIILDPRDIYATSPSKISADERNSLLLLLSEPSPPLDDTCGTVSDISDLGIARTPQATRVNSHTLPFILNFSSPRRDF